MKTLITLLLLALLGSCATSYQKSGFSGGYKDMRISNDMYKVSFRGNGYTGSDTVHEFFLRRCAEVTVEQGYDFFAFVEQNANSSTHNLGSNTSGTINQNYTGGYNYTANTQSYSVRKHRREGVIKLFKKGKQPSVAFNAKEYLKNFQSKK